MPRFRVVPEAVQGDVARITGSDARHILRVLRRGVGDVVPLLLPSGERAEGVIVRASPRRVIVEIGRREPALRRPRVDVVLAQAIPKGQRMDGIIRAASELGVAAVIPVVTERTVVRLQGDELAARVSRWRRIAVESQKQCERPDPLEVCDVLTLTGLHSVLGEAERGIVLTPDADMTLGDALENVQRGPVVLIIGPEGGLTDEEVAGLAKCGARPAVMGQRILRMETAAVAACVVAMHRIGEM